MKKGYVYIKEKLKIYNANDFIGKEGIILKVYYIKTGV
jgi:hypothetical protein